MAGGGGWWEYLVDGVKQGPTVVSEDVFVGGLEEGDVVIDKDLKEVVEASALRGVVEGV